MTVVYVKLCFFTPNVAIPFFFNKFLNYCDFAVRFVVYMPLSDIIIDFQSLLRSYKILQHLSDFQCQYVILLNTFLVVRPQFVALTKLIFLMLSFSNLSTLTCKVHFVCASSTMFSFIMFSFPVLNGINTLSHWHHGRNAVLT